MKLKPTRSRGTFANFSRRQLIGFVVAVELGLAVIGSLMIHSISRGQLPPAPVSGGSSSLERNQPVTDRPEPYHGSTPRQD